MHSSAIRDFLVQARVEEPHFAGQTSRRANRQGTRLVSRLLPRLERAIDRFAAGQMVALSGVEIVGHSVPATGSRRS